MFASSNPFAPLSLEPEYSPLAYIDVDVKSADSEEWKSARAMVDCGGQGSFINDKLSQSYQLPRLLKQQPVSLVLADGSPSQAGHITHYNPLVLRTAGNEESLGLDIAPTSHDIILGMPWLKKHDPAIRFGSNHLTFDSSYCQKNCAHYGQTIPLHQAPHIASPTAPPLGEEKRNERDGSTKVLPPRNLSEVSRNMVPRKSPSLDAVDKVLPPAGPILPSKPTSRTIRSRVKAATTRSARRAPPVSLVGPHAFAMLCNQPGAQLFVMSVTEAIELASMQAGEATSDPDLSSIPPEYHEFADLFSQKEADMLPPHRSYDHQIPLEPGTTPPFGSIYSMSPTELEVLRKYIEENLKKGFIRHSQSSCGAPILFVKKADGGLRLCVDYRGLNKITSKNRYPLPLIAELLDRISRAKYFTKFDVRDGYHRLRMAEGEEWKTAFRCRYGLYEYMVMPFGLCSAPGTFQHYMNDTFREFLDKFLIVYLDDLLIYSDSLAEHKRHVRMVLERLREAGLCLKPSKCQFHMQCHSTTTGCLERILIHGLIDLAR